MTKISEALTYGLTIRESANDGSDFTNPAADYRRLFLGEDGALHLRDSAGTITSVGGGGSLVLLEQHTASSSATLDFTTFISATYDTYKIIGTDVAPADNNVDLLCRIGTGGGPTYDSGGNYEWAYAGRNNSNSDAGSGGSGATGAKLASNVSSNAAYGFACFELTIHGLQSTAHRKYAHGTATWTNASPGLVWASGGFHWVTSGTAATALQFLMSSGNIASGTIRIYGIAKT